MCVPLGLRVTSYRIVRYNIRNARVGSRATSGTFPILHNFLRLPSSPEWREISSLSSPVLKQNGKYNPCWLRAKG